MIRIYIATDHKHVKYNNNIYSSVIECLIDRTNKPNWAEGQNYLTVAKRINRASTHPTVVLGWAVEWAEDHNSNRGYEYFDNVNSGFYEYFKNINSGYYEFFTGARKYMSGAREYVSGAREWCRRVVHESGARE